MSVWDILHLALRNLRQAKLRATLTTRGAMVGVSVLATSASVALPPQSNMLDRPTAADAFNAMQECGRGQSGHKGEEGQGPRGEDELSTRGEQNTSRMLDEE